MPVLRKTLTRSERLAKCRVDMLRVQPFYGALAMRLGMVEDSTLDPPTAATDGTYLRYHPEYIDSLTDAQVRTVVAHEALHCGMKHPYRFGARDPLAWNVATDHNINLTLKDAGFDVPANWLQDEQYRDPRTGYPLASEIIYARLPKNDLPDPHSRMGPAGGESGQATEPGEEDSQPDPNGEPEPGDGEQMSESDWDIETIAAAAAAERAGKGSGAAGRAAAAARAGRVDWREVLKGFITNEVPNGWTWMRPNRRFAWQGIYLPGVRKENCPPIGVAVDTSGSITQDDLNRVAEELTTICAEVLPERIDVVYVDAEVCGTETFTPDDGPITLDAKGGGGTAFQPGLDHFTNAEEPVAAVIYITDLYGPAPEEPDYPVLWVIIPTSYHDAGPFGTSIKLDPAD